VRGASHARLARECRSALRNLPTGLALTPVKGKRPYRPRWSEEPPVARELVAEEIERGHATGFALRTGPVSAGIFALDEDGPGALALLAADPGELPRTLSCASGRPGHRQRFFTVSEGRWPSARNRTVVLGPGRGLTSTKVSLRFGSMISCIPPGLHPGGRRYRWAAGLGPGEIAPAPLPEPLFRQAEYEPQEAESIVNAAWRGHRARVAEALRDGSPPDAAAADGYTALLRAIWGGHTACARILLEAGAPPDQHDPLGRPALLLASEVGHTAIMAALLDAGAEVAARDPDGRTPLHGACWGGHAAAVEMLTAAGADRASRDRDGREPADEALAWRYDELVELHLARSWAVSRVVEASRHPLGGAP
jgi:Bifunctional DNA primase/polymerase, N-terminal/Ankyrin repeats (3 copies)/Ankyrin repeat